MRVPTYYHAHNPPHMPLLVTCVFPPPLMLEAVDPEAVHPVQGELPLVHVAVEEVVRPITSLLATLVAPLEDLNKVGSATE